MTSAERNAWRLDKNAASKNRADHDGELWDNAEIELLLTWDRTEDELDTMAEILGRTREACRQRYDVEVRQPMKTFRTKTTTETVTNYYSNWDPSDRSEWFV
jgi:hypothetical protein